MDQLKDEATENVVIGSLILNPKEYNSVAHYVTDLNVFSQQRARALWTKLTKMIKDCRYEKKEQAHRYSHSMCISYK